MHVYVFIYDMMNIYSVYNHSIATEYSPHLRKASQK